MPSRLLIRGLTLVLVATIAFAQSPAPPVVRVVRAGVEPIPLPAIDPGVRRTDYSFNVPAPAPPRPTQSSNDADGNPRFTRDDNSLRAAFSLSSKGWVDTQLTVIPGDQLRISATGSLKLPDNRHVSPDGVARGWKDMLRQFPLPSANTGQLIARIGAPDSDASVAFPLCAACTVTIHQAGVLSLRINLSDDLPATGSYSVHLHFAAMGHPSAAAPVTLPITPALFSTIPRRVADESGHPGDMVNFAFIGTAAQVTAALKAAGWVAVDKTTQDALLHGLLSTLEREPYLEMPMSTLYLFNRPQDFSFARASPLEVAAVRHHLRLWRTTLTVAGQPLFVGSATHDLGFERDQRNNDITHHIDPDVDKERGFILSSVQSAGVLNAAAFLTPEDPLREGHTATGGSFHSDGRILVMSLK